MWDQLFSESTRPNLNHVGSCETHFFLEGTRSNLTPAWVNSALIDQYWQMKYVTSIREQMKYVTSVREFYDREENGSNFLCK